MIRRMVLFAVLIGGAAFAQEHAEAAKGGVREVSVGWKWANFVILASLIGYFAAKQLPGYFDSRNAGIQKGFADAIALRTSAQRRTDEIEARLKNLESEISLLREHASRELSQDVERVHRETAEAIGKIQMQARNEIESAGKAARANLRSYTAALALEEAERKVRARITPAVDSTLFTAFVEGVR